MVIYLQFIQVYKTIFKNFIDFFVKIKDKLFGKNFIQIVILEIYL